MLHLFGAVGGNPAVLEFEKEVVGKDGPEEGRGLVVADLSAKQQFGEKVDGKFEDRFLPDDFPQPLQVKGCRQLLACAGRFLQLGDQGVPAAGQGVDRSGDGEQPRGEAGCRPGHSG